MAEIRPAYADDRQPYYEARRVAYDNGYREGLKEGERDGRRRDSYRYQDNRTWQRADKGYNRSFGDFERYRQQFRAGFSEGYQSGYSRYGQAGGWYGDGRAVARQDPYRYPNGGVYPDRNRYPDPYYGNQGPYGSGRYGSSAAYPNGLNDGIEKGREDARKHDPTTRAPRLVPGRRSPLPGRVRARKSRTRTSIAERSRKATSAGIGSSATFGESRRKSAFGAGLTES